MNFKPKIIEANKPIQDLVVLEPEIFRDFRGENFEGFKEGYYSSLFSSFSNNWEKDNPKFTVDSFSKSRRSVIRGFHGDTQCWKLIQVLSGDVWFAVIDSRENSPTLGKIYQTLLSASNRRQVLVPRGCVNAHQCLSEECLFSYKLSGGYVEPKEQIHMTYRTIAWPIENSILSERDKR